jgi:hypothetical protein
MRNLRRALGTVFTILLMSMPLTALAGEQMAFKQKIIKSVQSGAFRYVTCASVDFHAPETGYVVVTASGMALFDSKFSDLTLSLKKSPAGAGPWLFTLTPGLGLTQSFTIRYVFSVTGGDDYTFYLNGTSVNGPGRNIRVETGSITAEFYPSGNVQRDGNAQGRAEQDLTEVAGSKDGRTNGR